MPRRNKQRAKVRRLNPPQIPTNVAVRHIYRFRSTSATTTVIQDTNLCDIGGAMCTVVNTALRPLALTVKVHSVAIWAPPASQGAAATCSIAWTSLGGNTYLQEIEVSDTTVSTAVPAHVHAKPPPGSGASVWLGRGGVSIFWLTAPVGSVIDVDCTHVLNDTVDLGTALGVAAGNLGQLYWPPLDGVTDVYLPVSLQTTT